MDPQQQYVLIVQAMVIHYAITHNRGSDWVASMVREALITDPFRDGPDILSTALETLRRVREEPVSMVKGA